MFEKQINIINIKVTGSLPDLSQFYLSPAAVLGDFDLTNLDVQPVILEFIIIVLVPAILV
jgi:hypothetical protein